MELYFLRHGLAGDRSEWEGDDSQRPLTDEGRRKMRREAEGMARLGVAPDLILTSPLVRAAQTAEIAAKGLDSTDRLVQDPRLSPDFGPEQLAEILKDHAAVKAIMLVGHEPDFSATIGYLIGGGQVVCKKGGLALVELPDPETLRGQLVWLLPPKALSQAD